MMSLIHYNYLDILTKHGYNVADFTSPLLTLKYIKENYEEFDLVIIDYKMIPIKISDYKMATMNGNELCNKLIGLNPKLKVILISAYDNVEYNTSKFTFLNKPIPIAQLLKIVKETLAK